MSLEHKTKKELIEEIEMLRDRLGIAYRFDGIECAEFGTIESEILLKSQILDSVLQAAIATDLNGKVIYWNRAAELLYQYSASEAIGKQLRDLLTPIQSYKEAEQIVEKLLKGETWQGEFNMKCKDGRVFPALVSDSPIFDNEGKIIGIIGLSKDYTERKKLDAKISKLTQGMEQSPVSVVITNTEGIIEYVNPQFSQMTGYSYREVVNKKTNMLNSGHTPIEYYKEMWRTIKSGRTWQGEFLNKKKNGELFWQSVSISPIRNSEGEITHFVGIKDDISLIKQASAELKKNEAQIRALLEANPDLIFIQSRDGTYLSCHTSQPDKLLVPLSELIGNNMKEILPSDLVNQFFILFEEVLLTKQLQVIEYSLPDGDVELYFEARIINFESDKLMTIVRDITQRKKIELEVSKLQKGVEQSPASIVITDVNGVIEYVNPKFSEVTGYTAEEVIGQNPRILKSDSKKSADYKDMWQVLSSGREWRGEFYNMKKNGEYYWESASISSIRDKHDKITHFVAVKEDITQRKQVEEELLRLNQELTDSNQIIEAHLYQKNALLDELSASETKLKETVAAKDKFFSIVAHDLRGPFSGFLNLTDLMAKSAEDLSAKEIITMATAINKSANSVYKLIEDLLQWARTQNDSIPFNLEELDIYEIAFNAVFSLNQIASNKNIKLRLKVPINTILLCDRNMMTTVFRNLISNAIKFTAEDGVIEIGGEYRPELQNYQFFVADNGVGMDTEHINKLFRIDTYVTTQGTNKESGTGLGLILVKEFVEKHDGKIWAESEVGKGSTFYFSLPRK